MNKEYATVQISAPRPTLDDIFERANAMVDDVRDLATKAEILADELAGSVPTDAAEAVSGPINPAGGKFDTLDAYLREMGRQQYRIRAAINRLRFAVSNPTEIAEVSGQLSSARF